MKKLLVVLSALVVMAAACNEFNVTVDPRFTARDIVDIAVDTTGRDFVSVRGVNGTIEVTGVPGATSITGTAVIRVVADSQAEADAHIFDVDVGISTETMGMVSIFTQHLFVDAGGRNYIVDYVSRYWVDSAELPERDNWLCTSCRCGSWYTPAWGGIYGALSGISLAPRMTLSANLV